MKPSLNEILDKIVLMAKILQEWSWKERPDEWRKEMMENMEEELTTRTNNISLTVDGIAREAQETWKKLEEMTGKVTEISTKIATLGNAIPDRQTQTDEENRGAMRGPTGTSYAHAVQTNIPLPREIQHHQHNTAVKEAEIKDRCIVVITQTPSDWALGEKELVAKANIAIERIVDEEGAETTKPVVIAATKITNKGASLLLRSAEEVKWIKEDDRMKCFATAWGSAATIRPNYAEVVVEALPVETPIDSPIGRRIEATKQQFFCANCKKAGHGAASRECPEFQRKLKERAKWDPERAYRLFVTRNPSTWGRMDEPTNKDFDQGWRTTKLRTGEREASRGRTRRRRRRKTTTKIENEGADTNTKKNNQQQRSQSGTQEITNERNRTEHPGPIQILIKLPTTTLAME
ncbi:hypothetical protein DFH05DRAFT_1459294 [Lentinula detonsa]|uniref:Uncharacterized protein n=1 Tax=Lentinula detonsa TaxID=2804962 RepID=A0A9W8P285_9AGAR|nr:hypothetical protein DFH05DRAFT_1459294 [Lentinula detonsa]